MLYDPKWAPPEVKVEPWREILKNAAEIIEREGWTQGSYHKGGGHCAIGAINKAAMLRKSRAGINLAIDKLHGKLILNRVFSRDKKADIILWNDFNGDKFQLLNAMRKAAEA